MAPRGKRFFHKPENLSSIPRTLVKKMLLKAHLYNPNTGCGGRRMPRLAGVQVEQEILCARARAWGGFQGLAFFCRGVPFPLCASPRLQRRLLPLPCPCPGLPGRAGV